MLLLIALSEDVDPNKLKNQDQPGIDGTEIFRCESQITSLKTVDERQPDEITESKHKAEAVGSDINLIQYGSLYYAYNLAPNHRMERANRLRLTSFQ